MVAAILRCSVVIGELKSHSLLESVSIAKTVMSHQQGYIIHEWSAKVLKMFLQMSACSCHFADVLGQYTSLFSKL